MTYIDINSVSIENINSGIEEEIAISVLRLDKIHPVISGNKWFKLKYYLQDAKSKSYNSILTFGGAFSNHIAATALAASVQKFQSIGIIRGEEPEVWSHTLLEAKANGMQLYFVSREKYNVLKRTRDNDLLKQFGSNYIIPEGGYGALGVKGAADILRGVDTSDFTHIVCAVGTGTTIAGLIKAALPRQQIIGISAMKNNTGLLAEISELLHADLLPANFTLNHNYHFGGYAKHTPELLCWMNDFFSASRIPLDFVYTAKAMYGISDMIANDHFPPGSKILMVHTGGLQGNLSTKPGLLKF
ncbi:MAG: pyridoxal-phosphate dependent enzyme [Agriterribacter sp.]